MEKFEREKIWSKEEPFRIELPQLCLVAMVGATSSGKTSFANRFFKPTEVLSSDFFRGMICDDENSQDVSAEAFDLLFYAARKRLVNGKLTVVDATNLQKSARAQVLQLAREQNVHAAAIVLDLPEGLLLERNRARAERNFPERVIRQHSRDVKRSIKDLKKEGFRFIYVIRSQEQLEHTEIVRAKLWNDKREEHGPFDVIGDIHGCCDELEMLLEKLGYVRGKDGHAGGEAGAYFHPEGRKAVFVGDFCDRGPRNADVLRLVMDMVKGGSALAVPGNHDVKLLKYLRGKKIAMTHGIDRTIAEMEEQGEAFRREVEEFIDGLISHYVLDDGKLVVAHAGLRQEYIGRGSGRVREFCLYGETTGETDEFGLPVRLDWAADYRGRATIVYGHVAGREVKGLNGTYCIDTGCVFGGKLTAYRYPERELVSVDALQEYYEPVKPLEEAPDTGMGDLLTVGDFQKKLHITTELTPAIDIHENNAAAALETMSRFAADPHWLIYLPPTMSPCETSGLDEYLEHPLQAFAYYQKRGIRHVVCEKKHMGSRAVIVLCRTAEVAKKRFGITDGTRGIIYTRTGRRFFDESTEIGGVRVEETLLDRLEKVLHKTGFWEDFHTEWVCLDTELMPWSEKAQGLLKTQYGPTGRAGLTGLLAAVSALEAVCQRENEAADVDSLTSGQNVNPAELLTRYREKLSDVRDYVKAYGEYCWQVESIEDFRIAPFHVLACEGCVFGDKEHVWHMETIRKYITGTGITGASIAGAEIAGASITGAEITGTEIADTGGGFDKIFIPTPYLCVDTEDENSVQAGVQWWLELTENGGEGMVVKPTSYIAKQNGTLLQPAVKCRGREYLRIIYGPEYLEEEHLKRLKKRSLSRKRSLALKEFSLGMESLARFVKEEPLYRVHECAFGVLALESEPVDPRL